MPPSPTESGKFPSNEVSHYLVLYHNGYINKTKLIVDIPHDFSNQ